MVADVLMELLSMGDLVLNQRHYVTYHVHF